MELNVILGTTGLALGIVSCLLTVATRRSPQRVAFLLGWCLLVYWLVFEAPHINGDMFTGLFSLLVSAGFLFKAVSPKYAYPAQKRLRQWLFGKRFAARIDLANERMARRRAEAERRNISVYEVMQEEALANRR